MACDRTPNRPPGGGQTARRRDPSTIDQLTALDPDVATA
jgi:hypothetical protein